MTPLSNGTTCRSVGNAPRVPFDPPFAISVPALGIGLTSAGDTGSASTPPAADAARRSEIA
jgi:hypothetical protein